jgi:hypothetical protein
MQDLNLPISKDSIHLPPCGTTEAFLPPLDRVQVPITFYEGPISATSVVSTEPITRMFSVLGRMRSNVE